MRATRGAAAVTAQADDFATLDPVSDLELRELLEVVVAEDLGDSLAVLDDEAADLEAVAQYLGLAHEDNRAVADCLEWGSRWNGEVKAAVRAETEGLAGFG